MRVIWSERALSDLSAIEAYIARDNPAAASGVKQRVMAEVRNLDGLPLMGRPGRVHGTRELVITRLPYIVAYRVTEDHGTIIAVIHGTRKWPESL